MIMRTWIFRGVRVRRVRRRVRRSLGHRLFVRNSETEYKKHKESARAIVAQKINEFNEFYRFNVGRISIRNQRSRWGSCSKKGNLNFNYRLALLPDDLANYLIVHELCHIGEFNHSKDFWNLVAKTLPQHAELRKQLRKIKF